MKEIEKHVEYKVKVVIEMDKERSQDKQIPWGEKNCNSISLFRYIFEGSHILERIHFQHKCERREET